MKTRRTHWLALFLVLVVCGALGVWVFTAAEEVQRSYDSIVALDTAATAPVMEVTLDNDTLVVPNWTLFHTGALWSLVAKSHELPASYTATLVDVSVAHANDVTAKVSPFVANPLGLMVAAAEADGNTLVLSSAYRSADEQQQTYDYYKETNGETYADQYVAPVNASEHQTGLAVDLASSSSACLRDSGNCELTPTAIMWLKENASRFGFIQRYPAGKQSITGVSGEAWHYRYVGVPLATFLTEHDLTLDEFVEQVVSD